MMNEDHIVKLDNDMSDSSDIMQMLRLSASNINGLSRQMGLVNARIDKQSERIDKVEEEVTGIKSELTVNRAQANRIKKAIGDRVTYVLKISHDGGKVSENSVHDDVLYRPGFFSRLYTDARAHSRLGTPYYATIRTDFDEVMTYINSWFPEVEGGVEGYKHYLDIRREEREKSAGRA